jgi:hypothetical protein
MAVTVLRNNFNGTTSSAPNLTGIAGSLISVLDFCLVTTLGWTKDYSATNKAAYRAPAGNRFLLWVDDSTGQNARWSGFEAMSAITPTGTGQFPTSAQVSGGLFAFKSSANDATARPWLFVSNGKIFYLLWQYSGSSATGQGMAFGDFTSYKGSDAFNVAAIGDIASGATTTSIRIGNVAITMAALSGHYIARTHAQTGTSINVGKAGNVLYANGATELGAGGCTYPTPADGGLILSPVWLFESTTVGLRGHLPGFWSPCHARALTCGDTFSGETGTALDGKTFEVFNLGNNGQVCLETTDTWDA